MGESDTKDGSSEPQENTPTSTKIPTVEQAKKFLQDDRVRLASPEKKSEFLRSKGLEDSQIVELLDSKDGERNEEACSN